MRKNDTDRRQRVLVIWDQVPGYFYACLRAVANSGEASMLVITRLGEGADMAAKLSALPGVKYIGAVSTKGPSERVLHGVIRDFSPTITLAGCCRRNLSSRLAKTGKTCGSLAIWAADNYWRGSYRDYANFLLARCRSIYRFFDAAWVPGALGREYVRKLGFADREVFDGVYSCDTSLFRSVGESRFAVGQGEAWPARFFFVGQYIARKNVATLIDAYREYRATVADPWELWCAGQGPLKPLLRDQPGVVDHGYQGTEDCARLMSKAGVFVLPSWVDHWPLVIHEATSAGLPVLASHGCGSTVELVREGYNGYKFPAGDAHQLAMLMRHISCHADLTRLGQNSLTMSRQFSPELWQVRFLREIPFRMGWDDIEGAVEGKESAVRSEV